MVSIHASIPRPSKEDEGPGRLSCDCCARDHERHWVCQRDEYDELRPVPIFVADLAGGDPQLPRRAKRERDQCEAQRGGRAGEVPGAGQKSKTQVRRLLGPTRDRSREENAWFYVIGPERGDISVDTEMLTITFKGDRVRKVRKSVW